MKHCSWNNEIKCLNSNYNNICSASTHRRMPAASGRNLRIWRTRSVGTRRMILSPTCRLLVGWNNNRGYDWWFGFKSLAESPWRIQICSSEVSGRSRCLEWYGNQIDQAKKEVSVKIYGKLINEQYYRLLKANPDLSLYDCIALDMVQKHER